MSWLSALALAAAALVAYRGHRLLGESNARWDRATEVRRDAARTYVEADTVLKDAHALVSEWLAIETAKVNPEERPVPGSSLDGQSINDLIARRDRDRLAARDRASGHPPAPGACIGCGGSGIRCCDLARDR